MRLSTAKIRAIVKKGPRPKPKTTNYRRGVSCEYRARDILREHGYLVVRAAGSHGAWDLSAIHYDTGAVRLIQVKKGRLRAADVQSLCAERIPRGARAELWHFNDRSLNRFLVTPDGIVSGEDAFRPGVI